VTNSNSLGPVSTLTSCFYFSALFAAAFVVINAVVLKFATWYIFLSWISSPTVVGLYIHTYIFSVLNKEGVYTSKSMSINSLITATHKNSCSLENNSSTGWNKCFHSSFRWMDEHNDSQDLLIGCRFEAVLVHHGFFSCLQLFKHTVLNSISLAGCRTWCPTDQCCKALINRLGQNSQTLIIILIRWSNACVFWWVLLVCFYIAKVLYMLYVDKYFLLCCHLLRMCVSTYLYTLVS